ncbi:hypothetical protein FA13DRAFT_672668 [Coprinellus micaceus]|uniref:C2H2-type domain-containing protein n=1 Tax=Coprinellus micaceus TaxID=71717 RepID=A0A4Y7T588_COPMI|nr:hypothetical protein FA13DRAFT_672668 [Coprinellus micaceus]
MSQERCSRKILPEAEVLVQCSRAAETPSIALAHRTEHHAVQPTVVYLVDRSPGFGCSHCPARFPTAWKVMTHARSKHRAAQNATPSNSEEEKTRKKAEKRARKVERRARKAEKKPGNKEKRKRNRNREEAAGQENKNERRVLVRWSTTRGARIAPVSPTFSCYDCGAWTSSPSAIQAHCIIAKHTVAWPCAPLMAFSYGRHALERHTAFSRGRRLVTWSQPFGRKWRLRNHRNSQ